MRTENVLCLMHIHFLPAMCFIGSLNSKSLFNLQVVEGFLFRLSFALLHKRKCLRDNAKHHFIAAAKDRSFCYLFSCRTGLKNKRKWF